MFIVVWTKLPCALPCSLTKLRQALIGASYTVGSISAAFSSLATQSIGKDNTCEGEATPALEGGVGEAGELGILYFINFSPRSPVSS